MIRSEKRLPAVWSINKHSSAVPAIHEAQRAQFPRTRVTAALEALEIKTLARHK
jgi:hypothetical protein